MVHLMSAGRLRYLPPGEKGPKTPVFRLRFEDGGELVLTEAGKQEARRRLAPAAGRARGRARPPRPRGRHADGRDARADPRRRLAPPALAPARPARDRRDRPRVGERDPERGAPLALRALDPALRGGDRAARDSRSATSSPAASSCGSRAPANAAVYRVHDRLGEPCPNCHTPLARVDFEEHTIYYCPECQTDGRVLKDRRMSRLLR